jgi:glycosyltransferase involved in cell wall biosynthesis
MKVLHIVAGDMSSGASRGAYWLHLSLIEQGINSTILTNSKSTLGDPTVLSLAQTPLLKLKLVLLPHIARLPIKLYKTQNEWNFSTGFDGVDITKHSSYKNADIIHLHWINGLLSLKTLKKMKKPVIWTMRDMWPMTGGCHYAMGCEQYKSGCGQCPELGSKMYWDISQLISRIKRASLPKNIKLVGISHWLTKCAEDAKVFERLTIQTISNNIDIKSFFPIDQEIARKILGLPNKKIILIGAQVATSFYKGFDLFVEAINKLTNKNIHLVIFGKINANILTEINVPYTNLGFLSDPISLRLAYSAADVFVAPSRMEAFGKTLAESMACGVPVVCFNATGPKDIVDHQKNGYLAKAFDTEDLANGIEWVINSPNYQELRDSARNKAVDNWRSEIIAQKYIELYKNIVTNSIEL